MKTASALMALLWLAPAAGVTPELRHFQYEAPVQLQIQSPTQVCAAIDPAIFMHAGANLADLRLYQGTLETPYAIHLAQPVQESMQRIPLLNVGKREGHTEFDAEMPDTDYGDLQLGILGFNFLATVTVTGRQLPHAGPETAIGSYTVFDFSREKLGRSSVLHLPRSNFRYLHFHVDGPIEPGELSGITILHEGAVEAKYVTAASTSLISIPDRQSEMVIPVSSHTPIDRVLFTAGTNPVNFSRDVRIRVAPMEPSKAEAAQDSSRIQASGTVLRLHRVENGRSIDEERLSVDAPRLTTEDATLWTVTVDNGDDVPVSWSSVQLQMIERDICFDAVPGASYTLYYGDPALSAPVYDYASLFKIQKNAAMGSIGREAKNLDFVPRPDTRPFTERYPVLLWIALGAVIVVLGTITVRNANFSRHRVHR